MASLPWLLLLLCVATPGGGVAHGRRWGHDAPAHEAPRPRTSGLVAGSGGRPAHCHADPVRNPAPQVVIAGVPKSGSTALHSKLCAHPDIDCGAVKKEPNTLRTLRTGNATMEELYSQYIGKLFQGHDPAPGNLTMDGSVWYYYFQQSRELMQRLLPCSKLLFIVRDPVQRARSNYFHSGVPGKNFFMYIKSDFEVGAYCHRKVGQNPEDMQLGLTSRFVACLRTRVKAISKHRWAPSVARHRGFDHFRHPLYAGYYIYFIHELRKHHDVHVVTYDDLVSDSTFEPMIDGVAQFLGIAPFLDRQRPSPIDHNRKGQRTAERSSTASRSKLRLNRRSLAKLKAIFKPQVEALTELTGRHFNWTYDTAGRTLFAPIHRIGVEEL